MIDKAFNDPRTTRESTAPITREITEIVFSPPSKHYPDRTVLDFHYRNYEGLHIVPQQVIWGHFVVIWDKFKGTEVLSG